jgi:hypothetical protein
MGRLAGIIQHKYRFLIGQATVGEKMDFIDSPRRHEGHEVFAQAL